MKAFGTHWNWDAQEDEQELRGLRYWELLRLPEMSMGRLVLKPGDEDAQEPHTEAEIYCVIHGAGRMSLGDADVGVCRGSGRQTVRRLTRGGQDMRIA